MGKKKIRVKAKYGRKEFVEMVCAACGICGENSDPIFCFDVVYEKHRKKFIKKILPNLIRMQKEAQASAWGVANRPEAFLRAWFEEAFCYSGLCGECGNKMACGSVFLCQLRGEQPPFKVGLSKKRPQKNKKKNKNKKKKKRRWVAAAYPTFFCSEGSEEEIARILGENNNLKQNKDSGSTDKAKVKSNSAAANTES